MSDNTPSPVNIVNNTGITPEGRVLANIVGCNPVFAQQAIDKGTINRITVGRVQLIG